MGNFVKILEVLSWIQHYTPYGEFIRHTNFINILRWETKCHVKRKRTPWTAGFKADWGYVSRGSNLLNYTFYTLILKCLLLASDTWHGKLKKPVTLETKGLQAKNDPTQSEQLTAIYSDWAGAFNFAGRRMFALPFSFPSQPHRLYQKTEEVRSYEEGSPMKVFLLRRRYLLLGAALALAAAMLFAACLPELLMG